MTTQQGKQSRRLGRVAMILMLGGLFFLHAPAPALGQGLRPTRIAHAAPDDIGPMILYLGRERGYFAEEGINPIFLAVKTVVAIAAQLSGDLDFTMSATQSTKAALEGAKVKALFTSSNRSFFWLHARPEIKSYADLKGKRIGVDALGSGPHIAISALLAANVIDPQRDVRFTPAGAGMTRFAALKAGAIDALASTPSTFSAGQKAGLTLLGFAGEMDHTVYGGVVATDRMIKEQPALVKGMVKGMVKGLKLFRQRREVALAALAAVRKEPIADVAILYDEIRKYLEEDGIPRPEAMRGTIDRALAVLGSKRQVPVELAFDLSFVRESNREIEQAGWRP